MDKTENKDQAILLLRSLRLFISEDVVRQVVTAISNDQPTYRFWKGDRNGQAICGKGTADKIKRFYKEGRLDQYVEYLGLDKNPETQTESPNDVCYPLMTGFDDLDQIIGGLHPWDLIILGGLPSVGKSKLALNIAINVAKTGSGVGLITLETRPEQYPPAILSIESKVNVDRLRLNLITESEAERVREALSTVSKLPLHTASSREGNVEEIRETVRKISEEKSLNLLVIDSLQQMTGSDLPSYPADSLSEILRNLKAMARELELTVLVVSQVNYTDEDHGGQFPGLSVFPIDVANHADVVMLLHRNKYMDLVQNSEGVLGIIVAKNRRGDTGMAGLIFDKRTLKFEPIEGYIDVSRPVESLPGVVQRKARGV